MPVKLKINPAREHNLQALETMPEVSVFMAAYYGVCQLRHLAKGQGDESKLLLELFRDTAEATYRFGVLWPVMVDYKGNKSFSPFFWRWFNWWLDWLILKHSPGQIAHLEELAKRRSAKLNEWRPPGDWLNYRAMPPMVL